MAPNPYIKAINAGSTAPASTDKKKERKSKSAKTTSTDGASSAAKGKGKAVDEVLRAEILALGGDEADLELLADVESDSEVEESGEQENAGGLLSDLKSFMKGLDFSAAGATAPASDDEDDGAAPAAAVEEPKKEKKDKKEKPAKEEKEEKPAEKKESKYEREERRKVEREAAKVEEKQRREQERDEQEEQRRTRVVPAGKSPWIVEPTPQWYAVPTPSPSASAAKPSPALVGTMHARAQTLLDKENALHAASLDPRTRSKDAVPAPTGLSKADQVFIQQVLSSGTSSDKVSALLLLVSSSPLHNKTYLDQLAALCKKKSRDESGRAVRGVVDWWRGEGGGSPDRKLRYFADQPALPVVAEAYEGKSSDLTKEDVERTLVLYAFEDWFKRWFFQVLQALEQMSVDPLPHPRNSAVMHLSNLLRDKPEQESNILRLLVNKLGDAQRSIASKTSHHLLQVLQNHPGMTPILVREVSELVLHPRTSVPTSSGNVPAASTSAGNHVKFGGDSDDEKAAKKKSTVAAPPRDHARDNSRYYGVTTLNQVMLKKEQGEVAAKMVDVYFEVFGDVLGRLPDKEETDDEKEKEDKKQSESKKRSRDDGNGKKGGKKGKGPAEEQDAVNDVDAKLVAAVLTGINRAFPFAKLDDVAFNRRLDTLFRITHTSTFNVSIQALMLIFRVSSTKQEFSNRFYTALYASLHDPRLTHSSKQALYLNLVFRATKADKDPSRVAAFVKRLIQILFGMETTFVLGALYIVGELIATVSGLRELLSVPESERAVVPAKAKETDQEHGPTEFSTAYDGKKREPRFANALNSCLWELTPLMDHYHPTVVQYASQILSGEALTGASDLEQFSLGHFLDRFVYREAKKSVASKGSSMMQSGLAGQDQTGRVTIVKGGAATEVAVNSETFKRQNVHAVPADQVFFHKYFTSKTFLDTSKSTAASKRKSRRKGGDGSGSDEDESGSEASINDVGEGDHAAFDDDELAAAMDRASSPEEEDFEVKPLEEKDEDETDSEAEAEIWKAMKASMPKAKGDSDVEAAGDASDEDVDGDDDDVAMFDYSDDEDDEVLKKIRAELAGTTTAGADSDASSDGGSDLQVDDMDDLAAFSGASSDDGDESDLGEDEFDAPDADGQPFKSAFPDEDDNDSDDDGFAENDDDVFGSDDDVPLGLPRGGAEESEDEEDEKRNRKEKKRKLKHLPTFASADDYAHLLGGSDDEEI